MLVGSQSQTVAVYTKIHSPGYQDMIIEEQVDYTDFRPSAAHGEWPTYEEKEQRRGFRGSDGPLHRVFRLYLTYD